MNLHALCPLTRRGFLKQTSAAAALMAAPALIKGAEQKRRIPIGFLGLGHSHFREKHEVVRTSADWELVGLCEVDEAKRSRVPAGAIWLKPEELFAKAEVVVIESPVKDHQQSAKKALEAGKHVHVEKPPADSVAGFKELQILAAKKNLLLQVGYMWRYNPGLVAVLDAARQGWLGEIYLARATMNTMVGAEQRREWGEFKGGAMFEQGCHLIDPLVRLMGKPERINSFLKKTAGDGLADNCVAVFEYPKAMAIVTAAPLQPNAGPQRFFEVLGKNGTAKVQPLEPPGLVIDLDKKMGNYQSGRNEIPLPRYRRYVDEFVALAEAIRNGTPLPVKPTEELAIQESLIEACGMQT